MVEMGAFCWYNPSMRPDPLRLYADALKLPEAARAALAGRLLESIDANVDTNAEAAWAAEFARRMDEIDAGKTRLVPWAVARRRIIGISGGRSKG